MVAKVQIKRTSTPNKPPSGLQPGELAIEMDTPTRLWVGVPAAQDPALQKLLLDLSATSGISYTFSPTAPTTPLPKPGDLWYDPDVGTLSIYVNDGNSSQWVQIHPAAEADVPLTPFACGRLLRISDTLLRFVPYAGNAIMVNGAAHIIPAVGIDLPITGLTALTLYYAYVYDNGGVLVGEFSTTGHATGVDGSEIKSGDPTRALIGVCYPMVLGAGVAFHDNDLNRLVRSWFNNSGFTGVGPNFNGSGGGSTVPAGYPGMGVRVVLWAGDFVSGHVGGFVSATTPGTTYIVPFVDGVQASANLGTSSYHTSDAAYSYGAVNAPYSCGTLPEGFHDIHPACYGSGISYNIYIQQHLTVVRG
jgi:hypothetical protein